MKFFVEEVPWRPVEKRLHLGVDDLHAARVCLLDHFAALHEGVPAAPILFTLDRLNHLGQAERWIEEELNLDTGHTWFKLGAPLVEVEGQLRLSPDLLEGTTRGYLV